MLYFLSSASFSHLKLEICSTCLTLYSLVSLTSSFLSFCPSSCPSWRGSLDYCNYRDKEHRSKRKRRKSGCSAVCVFVCECEHEDYLFFLMKEKIEIKNFITSCSVHASAIWQLCVTVGAQATAPTL